MQPMKAIHRSWFTLVELIVVIVILWVLSTIGFVSYNGYLWGARDSNRVTQLKNISDSLTLYATDKNLPLPDEYVTVQAGSNVAWYQWYAGRNTLELINYTNGWLDPRDEEYFTYYLSSDRKKVQLLAFLEETDNLQTSLPFIGQAHAADYSNRFAKVYGKKLWVMTLTSTKQPIQEVGTIATAGSLDISTAAVSYTAHMSDSTSENIQGTAADIISVLPNSSCKRIKEVWDSNGSGKYIIIPDGVGTAFEVYCDMENGWGGWTHIGSKIDGTANQTVWDFWTTLTSPGTPANVEIPQSAFRNVLTEMMACSTENCWVFPLNTTFKAMLENSTISAATGQSLAVKKVTGTTGFQSDTATSFWYDANSGSESAMFNVQWTNGLWATTNRWDMDGGSQWAWVTGDQWDVYVR